MKRRTIRATWGSHSAWILLICMLAACDRTTPVSPAPKLDQPTLEIDRDVPWEIKTYSGEEARRTWIAALKQELNNVQRKLSLDNDKREDLTKREASLRADLEYFEQNAAEMAEQTPGIAANETASADDEPVRITYARTLVFASINSVDEVFSETYTSIIANISHDIDVRITRDGDARSYPTISAKDPIPSRSFSSEISLNESCQRSDVFVVATAIHSADAGIFGSDRVPRDDSGACFAQCDDDPTSVTDPAYDPSGPSAPSDGGCSSGSSGGGGSGTQYEEGDYTDGETVDWETGIGNGGSSTCGAEAVVEYICVETWNGDSWETWSCGYATTC